MTSSLVGSEMCIRDRCSASAVTECWPWRRSDVRMSPAPRCRPGGSRTVSYTHLTLPTICSV
eukprot:2422538-Prorocentrum_lima.AAC.1